MSFALLHASKLFIFMHNLGSVDSDELTQMPINEKHVLIGIWSRVVKFDSTTQEDVVKDRALSHFIRHLSWGLPRFQSNPATTATTSSLEDASEQRTMAAFIMAVICSGYPLGQAECINEKLHITICCLALAPTL